MQLFKYNVNTFSCFTIETLQISLSYMFKKNTESDKKKYIKKYLCINLQYECHAHKSLNSYMKASSGTHFMLTAILPLFHISKLQTHSNSVHA